MEDAVSAEVERAADGPLTVDITTTGRRSGETRRIEIWIVAVDGRTIIGGTPGVRDWYANLLADPHVVVHLKGDVIADLPATAAPVTDVAERRLIWTDQVTSWYRDNADVEQLIESAPTVALTFS